MHANFRVPGPIRETDPDPVSAAKRCDELWQNASDDARKDAATLPPVEKGDHSKARLPKAAWREKEKPRNRVKALLTRLGTA